MLIPIKPTQAEFEMLEDYVSSHAGDGKLIYPKDRHGYETFLLMIGKYEVCYTLHDEAGSSIHGVSINR
jgi:hypothetical protein